MKFSIRCCCGISTFLALLLVHCLTIDPPLPPRLNPPCITALSVVPKLSDGVLQETVHITWQKDSLNVIGTWGYVVFRHTNKDTIDTPIRTCAGTSTSIYDNISILPINRTVEQPIYYKIIALDSLQRSSDTSLTYSLTLAPKVLLVRPKDTLQEYSFKWEVPQIFSQSLSFASVWKNDSLLWNSDSIALYTNGQSKFVEFRMPNPPAPLKRGSYFWSVFLEVVGQVQPQSITISQFTVAKDSSVVFHE